MSRHLFLTMIAPPQWAAKPNVISKLDPAAMTEISGHRSEILSVVDQAITDYTKRFPDAGDGFKTKSALSGEYYVAREFYDSYDDGAYKIAIMVHLLAPKESVPRDDLRDYMGLDVWIRVDPKDWTAEIRGIDSAVI